MLSISTVLYCTGYIEKSSKPRIKSCKEHDYFFKVKKKTQDGRIMTKWMLLDYMRMFQHNIILKEKASDIYFQNEKDLRTT